MKFLLFFLSLNVFALDNYVSGPDAALVFTDKAQCEGLEKKACYIKPEDHTITKIEDDRLVVDASKKAAKEQEKAEREAAKNQKLGSCEAAKLVIVESKKDASNADIVAFIKSCLL